MLVKTKKEEERGFKPFTVEITIENMTDAIALRSIMNPSYNDLYELARREALYKDLFDEHVQGELDFRFSSEVYKAVNANLIEQGMID